MLKRWSQICITMMVYSLTAWGAAPTVQYDWRMETRFGLDKNWDGIIDQFDTPEKVNPGEFNVIFDSCDMTIDNDWRTYSLYYEWYIDGTLKERFDKCYENVVAMPEGNHTVQLVVRNMNGDEARSPEENIMVQDWLIVSIGDSYASGEGNPDILPLQDSSMGYDLATCGVATLDDAYMTMMSLSEDINNSEHELNEHLIAHLQQAENDLNNIVLTRVNPLWDAMNNWSDACFPKVVWGFDFNECRTASDNMANAMVEFGGMRISDAAQIVSEGMDAVEAQIDLLKKDAEDALNTAVTEVENMKQYISDHVESMDRLETCVQDALNIAQLGARWADEQCHRSMNSKEAITALNLERSDPKTSVTFVSTACSGATIMQGLLGQYTGVYYTQNDLFDKCMDLESVFNVSADHDTRYEECCNFLGGCKKPQLDEVTELVGDREIDSLLISIGGNDVGFGDIIMNCVLYDNCNESTASVTDVSAGLDFLCRTAADMYSWQPQEFRDFKYNLCMSGEPIWKGISESTPITTSHTALEIYEGNVTKLSTLYNELKERIDRQLGVYPAHTYITEYPNALLDENRNYCYSTGTAEDILRMLPGLHTAETEWADQSVTHGLNAQVHAAATANGWQVIDGIYDLYGNDNGVGHGYCSSDPWFVRLHESLGNEMTASIYHKGLHIVQEGAMHPTRQGNMAASNNLLLPKMLADFYVDGKPRPLSGRPHAVITGAYHVNEGDSFVPTSVSWDDTYGTNLTKEWYASPWLQPFISTADGKGLLPQVTVQEDGSGWLSLNVTNPAGISSTASVPLKVNNVSPTFTINKYGDITLAYTTYYAGANYNFHVVINDPGVFDSHELYVDWGDGTETDVEHIASGTVDVTHRFDTNGTYHATFAVKDDDNGMSFKTLDFSVQNHPLGIDNDGDGYSEWDGDCDDNNRFYANPDATEICDYIDNNCNGEIDEVGCGVIYVRQEATGANDGSSWEDAYTNLQTAISAATDGQQIWVAKGTYKPGSSRDSSFLLSKPLSIFGGFAGNETKLTQRSLKLNPTVLSGDIGVAGDNSDNCYHVVTFNHAASQLRDRLDGFIIRDGNAVGSSSGKGGGLVAKKSAILANLTFYNNHAVNGGAADTDANSVGGGAKFVNCKFFGNSASVNGGAVYVAYNDVPFINCVFSGNSAGENGGAIAAKDYAEFDLLFSTLSQNSANGRGGAIWVDNGGVTQSFAIDINGSILWDNQSNSTGSEIAIVSAKENTFATLNFSAITGLDDPFSNGAVYQENSGAVTMGEGMEVKNAIDFVDVNGPDNTPGTLDDNLRLTNKSGGLDQVVDTILPKDIADMDYDGNADEALPVDADNRKRISGKLDMGGHEMNPLTFYVDASATGTRDGRSWQNAFVFLQDALAKVLPGETIKVAEGVYRPDKGIGQIEGDRMASFQMQNGVTLLGGYSSGGSEWDPNTYKSVLSGDINVEGDDNDNSYHVVRAYQISGAVLKGFTVTKGNANAGYHPENKGGGILIYHADMEVLNSQIKDNHAYHRGGGIWVGYNSPSIWFTSITDNSAIEGGGMAFERAASPKIVQSKLIGNHASSNGGAIYSAYSTNIKIDNTIINGNSAVSKGGGVYSVSGDTMHVNKCTIVNNSASNGSALYGASGTNGDANVTVENSIIWQNNDSSGKQIGVDHSTLSLGWSDLQGGTDSIYQNEAVSVSTHDIVSFDPLFTDAKGMDLTLGTEDDVLHLNAYSLAVDAGDPAAYYATEPAPNGGRINLGAYGNTSGATTTRTGAATIYVDIAANGKNNGTSWEDALTSLQYALTVAKSADEIRVAEGVYTPDEGLYVHGDRAATFHLKTGVDLFGGFSSGDSWADRDPKTKATVLSGDLNRDDGLDFSNNGENAWHVVTGSGVGETTMEINGFTIRGGNATNKSGGGMYVNAGSPLVNNCIFEYNMAENSGGAIFNELGGETEIRNSVFRHNIANVGGAYAMEQAVQAHVSNTLFHDNEAQTGGAISIGSIEDFYLNNVTFANNSAIVTGGAISNTESYLHIYNSIVWGNSAPSGSQIVMYHGALLAEFSDIEGGQSEVLLESSSWIHDWDAMIVANPMFNDSDFHLYGLSPCIDTGDAGEDVGDEPQPNGGIINMGVWGGTIWAAINIHDSDGDGIYDIIDIYPNDGPTGDWDGDGILNFEDPDDSDGFAAGDPRAYYGQGTTDRISGKREQGTQPYPDNPCGQGNPCIQGTKEWNPDAISDEETPAYDDRPDCDHDTQYILQGTNECIDR